MLAGMAASTLEGGVSAAISVIAEPRQIQDLYPVEKAELVVGDVHNLSL
jgi:hypothetical protein